jgi:hypothetical protein
MKVPRVSGAAELNELKREREEALRAISAAIHGLPAHLQRELNARLRALAKEISKVRSSGAARAQREDDAKRP